MGRPGCINGRPASGAVLSKIKVGKKWFTPFLDQFRGNDKKMESVCIFLKYAFVFLCEDLNFG